MRVAYVCADPGIPVFGTKGASVHVQEVLQVLLKRGYEIDLYCRRVDGEPWPVAAEAATEGRLRVHELGRIKGSDVADRERKAQAADAELFELMRRQRFDMVYERYSLWSTAGMAYAAECDVPGILEVNAPLPEEQHAHRGLVNRERADQIIAEAADRAAAVVCVSEPVAQWVREQAPAANVCVESNGVDVDRLRPAGTPASPFTVGFVGTLKPWHGTETLLEAFAQMTKEVPDARLLVVGHGPQAEQLQAQADSLGIRDQVEFTGAVRPIEIPSYLQRMHVATAPYPEGGEGYFSPLKVYEYMAAGVPVVASAVGQLPGVIDDGVTGVLVPGSDPRALASALVSLASHADTRESLAEQARAYVVASHTWTHVVERTLAAAGVKELVPCG